MYFSKLIVPNSSHLTPSFFFKKDFIEEEREKIKEITEKTPSLESDFVNNKTSFFTYKSKSLHEKTLCPQQNSQAVMLKKFAKDADILSKINRCKFPL